MLPVCIDPWMEETDQINKQQQQKTKKQTKSYWQLGANQDQIG